MIDTNGQELHNLKLQLGMGDSMIKAASSDELKEESKLASRHFANPLDKNYPTHTKEATERSVVYFFGSPEESNYPREEAKERLYKAARFWGVSDHYYVTKNASEAPSEGVEAVTEYAMGNKLPISTEDQINKSAKSLLEQREKIPFNVRSEAAMSILKAAVDLGLNFEYPELEIMSGVLPKDLAKSASAIKQRGVSFERLGVGSEIYKAAAEAIIDCNEDELDDVCDLIDTFERSKSAAKTVRGLAPIESCFFDAAPNETLIHMSNGTDVLFSQVKEAALAPFYALGATVPLEVTDDAGNLDCEKTASFLERIPKEDCQIFEKAFNECR